MSLVISGPITSGSKWGNERGAALFITLMRFDRLNTPQIDATVFCAFLSPLALPDDF